MGIFSRFSDIVNSNINAILEKAEDPEKMVRLMIQEMEDTLVEVRSAAARAIADKKELSRKLGTYRREEADWQKKAELAVNRGRDDLAKAALAEKRRVADAVAAVEHDHQSIEDGLAKLNHDIAALEEKLGDAKSRQKALIMRHATASKRLEVRKQLHHNRIDDALVRFEAFERKMEDIEGRVESYDLGRSNGGLAGEFDELESNETIERELAELKERISRTDQA